MSAPRLHFLLSLGRKGFSAEASSSFQLSQSHDFIVASLVAVKPLAREVAALEAWQLSHLAGLTTGQCNKLHQH